MRFDLTRPCADCPFLRKGGVRLHPDRAAEIAGVMSEHGAGGTFTCHKTIHGKGRKNKVDRQHCAGALLFAENVGVETQMMQVAERLGLWDRAAMDHKAAEGVFGSVEEMVKAQDKA